MKRPRPRIAQDQDRDDERQQTGDDEADVAQRDRPEDRDLVGRVTAAHGGDLDEPPDVPRLERQDREDVVLVDGQVAAGSRAGPPAATNGSHTTTMTASPIAAVRAISRHPPWVQNQAANGSRNGRACGLVITASARAAAASPLRPFSAKTSAASAVSR